LEAENDEDALQQAEALIRPMPAEVWLSARLVGSLPALKAVSISDFASLSQAGASPVRSPRSLTESSLTLDGRVAQ
jgi:hypothetical protein